MLATLKRQTREKVRKTREKMRGRPGHRFQDHYERAAKAKHKPAHLRRILNFALAAISLAIAVLLVVFPGPAIPFFFIAGLLLASESLIVAKAMDWLELKARAAWGWGKKRWDRLPAAARLILKILRLVAP